MLVPYTWTTCLLGLGSAGLIFWLVRRNLMHASYAMWWTAIGSLIVLGGLFPGLLDRIGRALGVFYPPILFVVLGFLALTLRLLLGDIERTRMDLQLRRMAQKMAHMQHRLMRLEERLSEEGLSAAASDGKARLFPAVSKRRETRARQHGTGEAPSKE